MTKGALLIILAGKQNGRPLREFAAEIGCTAAYLSDIYNHKRDPGPKILEYLNVTKQVVTKVEYFGKE